MFPRPLVLLIPLLLAGCATAPEPVVVEQVPVEDVEPEAPPPERAMPADSVYPLLVAEFALRRREYGVALEQYMVQAPELRDPGVSAHTTNLAQFMRREPEALEAARLWVELEPDSVEANNTLANLLVRRGRTIEAVPYVAAVARAGEDANFPVLLNGYRRLSPEEQSELVAAINANSTDSTLVDRNVRLLVRADVRRTRADQAVVRQLLDAVTGPARHTAHREHRCEQVNVQSE